MLTRRTVLGLGSLLALPSAALAALLRPAEQAPVVSRSVLLRISSLFGMPGDPPTVIVVSMQGVRVGDRLRVFREGGYPSGYTVTLTGREVAGQSATVTLRGRISSDSDSEIYFAEVLDQSGVLLASGRSNPVQELL